VGRLPAGARNINLLVEDSSGSRYVLRGCRRNPHRDRIIFQLDFQDHLRRCGIPVPQVVASQTGERCVESSPVSLWVIFRFVAGRHYRYGSRVQLLHAARCLSGIHSAGAGFTTRPVQDDTIPDLFKWWTHGEEMAALRAMFAGAGVEPELDFLDNWRTALTRDLPLSSVDELPRAWLHSDFHPSNVVFAGGQVRAVLDFDVVHHGFRLEDVVYAMFCFCRSALTTPAPADATDASMACRSTSATMTIHTSSTRPRSQGSPPPGTKECTIPISCEELRRTDQTPGDRYELRR
jgi:Ser/Thr protein kinase RdoA (MazF antagonist)